MPGVFIVSAARTPIGKFGGALAGFTAPTADSVKRVFLLSWWLLLWNGLMKVMRGSDVVLLAILLALAMVVLAALANDLRMLAFGEDDAKSRGVDVERIKLAGFLTGSIITGAAVAVSGIIGFVARRSTTSSKTTR